MNPISKMQYADPEARVYGDTVYIYVTNSLPFDEQINLDLVTTRDLSAFEIKRDILDISTYKGAARAVWAPTVEECGGKYYIVFAANDIHSEEEVGGLYIGVSDSPEGPFSNVFDDGRPLLNKIYNNAQPIDAHLFKDTDGTVYLYYGGWGHLMVCRMNPDMTGFEEIDGAFCDKIAREITPKGYVEAPCIVKLGNRYNLMYSSGNWMDGSYSVKAASSDSPFGPFEYYGDVLTASPIADGPGHNGAFYLGGKWYTAYHRRTVGDSDPHHRYLCIDKLPVKDERLQKITMT